LLLDPFVSGISGIFKRLKIIFIVGGVIIIGLLLLWIYNKVMKTVINTRQARSGAPATK